MQDNGLCKDDVSFCIGMGLREHAGWQPKWTIEKYNENLKLYAVEEIDGNQILKEGIGEFMKVACGISGATAFSNINSYIGVGDGTTAANADQTGLVGTNKSYAPMDAAFPQVTDNIMTFRATFGPTVGNHAWKEFTVANGNSDSAKNLNRKVESKLREKFEPDTWIVQLQISIS